MDVARLVYGALFMGCEASGWLWKSDQPHSCQHSAAPQLSAFKGNKSIYLTKDTRVKLLFPPIRPPFSSLPPSVSLFLCPVWVPSKKKRKRKKKRWDEMESMLSLSAWRGFGLYKSTGPNTATVTQRHPCGELTEITASLHFTRTPFFVFIIPSTLSLHVTVNSLPSSRNAFVYQRLTSLLPACPQFFAVFLLPSPQTLHQHSLPPFIPPSAS